MFYKKINNFNLFIKTIVYCGLASAIIHFLVLIFMGNIFSGSVDAIREFGKDNFLELFALFFLLSYSYFQKEYLLKSRLLTRVIVFILFVSNVLYFSRTMIVGSSVIVVYLWIYGLKQKNNPFSGAFYYCHCPFLRLFVYG